VAQKSYDGEDHKITVVIDRNHRIYLKGEKVDLKQLHLKLQRTVKTKGLVHLFLQADKEVKHGMVVEVMDLAKRDGVSSIIIAAQWEPEKEY
jgi:biopolymer transport protein ExbD